MSLLMDLQVVQLGASGDEGAEEVALLYFQLMVIRITEERPPSRLDLLFH